MGVRTPMFRSLYLCRVIAALSALAAVAMVGLVSFGVRPEMHVEQVTLPSLSEVSPEAWAALARKRICFGHQSVGYDILDGVRELLVEHPEIGLRIVETSAPRDFDGPVLAHSRLGRNGDPRSKLAEFEELISGLLREHADIAFFKFCYVDITAGTDVAALFAEYRETMVRLHERCPTMTVLHVTVPVCSARTGPKAWVKGLLRHPDDNIPRARFNALLRQEYASCAPLFHLAACEATAPDGKRAWYEADGCRVDTLQTAYTTDGGYLNSAGRRAAAIALLDALLGLASSGCVAALG